MVQKIGKILLLLTLLPYALGVMGAMHNRLEHGQPVDATACCTVTNISDPPVESSCPPAKSEGADVACQVCILMASQSVELAEPVAVNLPDVPTGDTCFAYQSPSPGWVPANPAARAPPAQL